MNTLVMGGTRFNGLHLVQELVRCGHKVTILNRGVTEAQVPREVRRLYADRKDAQQLREALGAEEFDVIFDISAYVLEDVQSMVDIFDGRAGHYVFASSTVVYAATNILPMNEDSPVDNSPRQSDYGRNKLICEDYLIGVYRQRHFPTTAARFSMVFGPDNGILDREQRMFMRLLRGRKVLVPGRGTTLGQIGHVDDEARALRMMALNPQDVWRDLQRHRQGLLQRRRVRGHLRQGCGRGTPQGLRARGGYGCGLSGGKAPAHPAAGALHPSLGREYHLRHWEAAGPPGV